MLGREQPTIFGDGKKTRDYVYVSDIVEANLGWGCEVSDLEVFETVAVATGYDRPPAYAPARPGEVERISLDASLACETWGWQPTVSLRDGVGLVVDHIWRTRPPPARYDNVPQT